MARIIPANLFTGFLGVGKTTTIIDILQRKPASERWAVLVNEYGEVGIDGALIEGQGTRGVTVREIGGGCVCCATAPELPVALHFLLTEAKPDRLLLETTGLGHPARLIDTIRDQYADRVSLKATIGLVSPSDFTCAGMFENPIFMDQVHLADVLLLNKADTATPETITSFGTWANGLFPPKLLIAAMEQGRLNLDWLDLEAKHERRALHPDAHAETLPAASELIQLPERGKPVRYPSPAACGWIFSPADEFDEDKLLQALQSFPTATRWKGVFRVDGEWVAINRAGPTFTCRTISYRRDSRLEVFCPDEPWAEMQAALLGCLTGS
ncbi:MAG: CobW family GTP-binding protein [Fimbriiglobus sp.]